jgi:hypothetical protein
MTLRHRPSSLLEKPAGDRGILDIQVYVLRSRKGRRKAQRQIQGQRRYRRCAHVQGALAVLSVPAVPTGKLD